MMKWLVSVLAITAATAAFWPAAGGAATMKGVVVARQHGTLLVASPNGLLRSVKGTARVGALLSGSVVVGRATHARVRGIVVRRVGTTLILSSNHHLLAIPNRYGRKLASASDTPPAPGSTTTTTTPTTPAPGAVVTTDVSIQQNGELEENDENQVGQSSSSTLSIQATVKAVAAGSVTLDVQGQSVTVSLPAGLTLPASLVGQTVTITVDLNQDNGNDSQGNDGQGGDHGGGGGDD